MHILVKYLIRMQVGQRN